RVRFDGGRFILPDTGETFSEAELLALLACEPERFTANVALRCIVQQHLFPVRAYVAGPGELAYWGQLKGLFAQFEQPMPIVYPRIRAVLTSMKTNKLLRKLGLTPADLQGNLPDLEERALRASRQDPALGVLERHRAKLLASVESMESDFYAIGRGGAAAVGLAEQFRGQVRQGLDHMERNLLRVDTARTEAIQNQLARLSTELAPERKPQERYYTLFSWVFQHGWDLVPRLIAALDHNDFSLQEVEL
ncbi:MAG: bacillithiol biosynthesis BshC, partial [Gammaproteobacteria bacterium]|nr:bacillithiol biosynthesis BshC [Gammaproteobacteria bacterium]